MLTFVWTAFLWQFICVLMAINAVLNASSKKDRAIQRFAFFIHLVVVIWAAFLIFI